MNFDKTTDKDSKSIHVGDHVRLCVWPLGRWKVEAVEGNTLSLVYDTGKVTARINEVILLYR
jgi:hypothetical protein